MIALPAGNTGLDRGRVTETQQATDGLDAGANGCLNHSPLEHVLALGYRIAYIFFGTRKRDRK